MEVTLDGWGMILALLSMAGGICYFFLQLQWSIVKLIDAIKQLDSHQTKEHGEMLTYVEKRHNSFDRRFADMNKDIIDLRTKMVAHDAKYEARNN